MKNSTFFSCLMGGLAFSYWGFASPVGGSDGTLPYIGMIPDVDISKLKMKHQNANAIPEVIEISAISSKYDSLPCASKLFTSVSDWNELSDDDNEGEIGVMNTSNLKGCLAVWWDKDEDSEGSEQTKKGNILLSTSDDVQGTLFMAEITVDNGIIKRKNEKLYYLQKKSEDETWKILLSGAPEDGELEGEIEDEADSEGDLKGTEITENKGKLEWEYVSATEAGEVQEGTTTRASEFLNKWLGNSSIALKAVKTYESTEGHFRQQQTKE